MSEPAVMPQPGQDTPMSQLTVLGAVNVLLENLRLLIILPVALALLVGIFSFFSGRKFTATAAVTPGGSETSRVSGLAAQFGVAVAPAVGTESAEFYRDLLVSREILRQVALTEYVVPGWDRAQDTVRGNLVQLYEIDEGSPNETMLETIRRLESDIKATTDIATNIITLTVQAPTPILAVAINRRVLQLADEYNVQRRRSQARMEREFVEARATEARRSLESAEHALEQFLKENRTFASSPQLAFQHQRLQRRVELQQQLYLSLSQSYEQARIEEVRDMPVLSVVTPPETVVEPQSRSVLGRAFVALLLGLILAIVIAFVRWAFARVRAENSHDYETFRRLQNNVTPAFFRRTT